MAFNSLAGGKIIGQGRPLPTPIALDPAPFKGALVYGDDGIVYVSNGTTWVDVGSGAQGTIGIQGNEGIQGIQGTYGPGFTILGSVPDVDAGGNPQSTLTTAFPGANIGEGVIDEADDELWIWDGSNWINIGTFRGVQGIQGSIGPQGVQGTIGEEGIQGSRGDRGVQGVQGLQGTQGTQGFIGNQGTQGVQGVQGPQAFQGVQGVQGLLGFQGVQGPQAFQGVQGTQGFVGLQGDTGDFGGLTFDYTYDNTTTDADPGTGVIRFNNTALNSVSMEMYIDDEDDAAVNVMDALLGEYAGIGGAVKGYFKVINGADVTKYTTYRIDSITDATGYWRLGITYLFGETSYTNGADLRITFTRNGDQGIQGVQGPQAFQGVQGLQGPQAFQGIQGVQGITGSQGAQGLQGIIGIDGGFSFDFSFNASTTPSTDPGVNSWKINNSNPTTATILTIDDIPLDQFTTEIDDFYDFIDGQTATPKGYLVIKNRPTGASGIGGHHFVMYEITDWTWDGVGKNWGYFNVVYIDGNVTDWQTVASTHGTKTHFSFVPAGPIGVQGVQGVQGNFGPQGIQGFIGQTGTQGTQGVQGDSGPQGIQGFIGQTGIQGAQGVQGLQGVQGPQGVQGVQGVQGTQGVQGIQGYTGVSGGITFTYNYNTSSNIATDPGSQICRLNNNTYSSVTEIFVDAEAGPGPVDLSTLYNSYDAVTGPYKAVLRIVDPANTEQFLLYKIKDITDNTGWFTLSVEYVTHNGMVYSDGDATLWTFSEVGAQGVQGPQAFQGVQGIQGEILQGTQGITGDTGLQGVQGVQGNFGPAGEFGGMTFSYEFDTDNTATDFTGFGKVKFNNSNLALATVMYIDDRDVNFVDIQPFLRSVDEPTSAVKGFVRIIDAFVTSDYAAFEITDVTEASGYFQVDVTFSVASQTSWNAAEPVKITFARTGDAGTDGAQGAQGTQGITGTGGAQGTQGTQGTTGFGFQGVQGVQGNDGNDGFGFTGTQGTQGTQGLQGTDGTDGDNGDPGLQGVQGIQGTGGTNGSQGVQGIQGTDGSDGFGGVGVQGNQGVQGVQGLQGEGPQGVQGPLGFGSQGVQGIQGNTGAQGIAAEEGGSGAQGFTGGQGVQGFQGVGIQGIQGIQGESGDAIQGVQGNQGFTGSGSAGVQGFTGIQGPQGLDGDLGNEGPQGTQGFIGTQGMQGTDGTGNVGPQGIQGMQGPQGLQGFSGLVGGAGPQGIQGIQGTQGFTGANGTGANGVQGVQGVQGDFGPQGVQGVTGTGDAGIQGSQGVQGITGGIGPQGVQGLQGTAEASEIITNNVHIASVALQGAALFPAMVEGGGGAEMPYTTAGLNPGGESNFYYISSQDKLYVENLEVEGNITLTGTLNGGSGDFLQANVADTKSTGDLTFSSNVAAVFGPVATSKVYYKSSDAKMHIEQKSSVNSLIITQDNAGVITTNFELTNTSGNLTVRGNVNSTSDARTKENVVTVDNALDKVTKLRGVYFDKIDNPGTRYLGVIAQEMQEVIPEVVLDNGPDTMLSVSYGNLAGLFIEALKELKKEVDEIKGL